MFSHAISALGVDCIMTLNTENRFDNDKISRAVNDLHSATKGLINSEKVVAVISYLTCLTLDAISTMQLGADVSSKPLDVSSFVAYRKATDYFIASTLKVALKELTNEADLGGSDNIEIKSADIAKLFRASCSADNCGCSNGPLESDNKHSDTVHSTDPQDSTTEDNTNG